MPDLVTLADAKTYLQLSGTAEDAFLTLAITEASGFIAQKTGRSFESVSRTAYLDGGPEDLILEFAPVASVTTVTDDGGAGDVMDSADYDFDPTAGLLYRIDGTVWPRNTTTGRREWEVVYVGGYATVPSSAKAACLWLVSLMHDKRALDLTSEKIADWAGTSDPGMSAFMSAVSELREVVF